MAEKIIAILSEACKIEGSEQHIMPSIGMAIFTGDGADPDTLLRNADIAMYHASATAAHAIASSRRRFRK